MKPSNSIDDLLLGHVTVAYDDMETRFNARSVRSTIYRICFALQLWPLLSNITNKFKADERIMERVCRYNYSSNQLYLSCIQDLSSLRNLFLFP